VQLKIVFQKALMSIESSQLVSKIMASGLLFLGKVPSLETPFYKRSSLMDVCSICHIEWFTPFEHRKPPCIVYSPELL
jgi:hypothetical protein